MVHGSTYRIFRGRSLRRHSVKNLLVPEAWIILSSSSRSSIYVHDGLAREYKKYVFPCCPLFSFLHFSAGPIGIFQKKIFALVGLCEFSRLKFLVVPIVPIVLNAFRSFRHYVRRSFRSSKERLFNCANIMRFKIIDSNYSKIHYIVEKFVLNLTHLTYFKQSI